jgi:hypothetical protein
VKTDAAVKIDAAVKMDTARKTEVATKLEPARKETVDVMRLPVAPDLAEKRIKLEADGKKVLAVARAGRQEIALPIPAGTSVEFDRSSDGSRVSASSNFITDSSYNVMYIGTHSITNNSYVHVVTLNVGATTQSSDTEITVKLNGEPFTILIVPEPPDRVTATGVPSAVPRGAATTADDSLGRLSPPNGILTIDGTEVPPPGPGSLVTIVEKNGLTIRRNSVGHVSYTTTPGASVESHTLVIGSATHTLNVTAGPESLETARGLLQRIHRMGTNAADVLWQRYPQLRDGANEIARIAYETELSATGTSTYDAPTYYQTAGRVRTNMEGINRRFGTLLKLLAESGITTIDRGQAQREVMEKFVVEIGEFLPNLQVPAGATETRTITPSTTAYKQYSVPDRLDLAVRDPKQLLAGIVVGTGTPDTTPDAPLRITGGGQQTLNNVPRTAKIVIPGIPPINTDQEGTYTRPFGQVIIKPNGVVDIITNDSVPPNTTILTITMTDGTLTLQRPVTTIPDPRPIMLPPESPTPPSGAPEERISIPLDFRNRTVLQLPDGTFGTPAFGQRLDYPDFEVRVYTTALDVYPKRGTAIGIRRLRFKDASGSVVDRQFNVIPVGTARVTPSVSPTPDAAPSAAETFPTATLAQVQEGRDAIDGFRTRLQEAYRRDAPRANLQFESTGRRDDAYHDRMQRNVQTDRELLALRPRMEAAIKAGGTPPAALMRDFRDVVSRAEAIVKAALA